MAGKKTKHTTKEEKIKEETVSVKESGNEEVVEAEQPLYEFIEIPASIEVEIPDELEMYGEPSSYLSLNPKLIDRLFADYDIERPYGFGGAPQTLILENAKERLKRGKAILAYLMGLQDQADNSTCIWNSALFNGDYEEDPEYWDAWQEDQNAIWEHLDEDTDPTQWMTEEFAKKQIAIYCKNLHLGDHLSLIENLCELLCESGRTGLLKWVPDDRLAEHVCHRMRTVDEDIFHQEAENDSQHGNSDEVPF